MYFGQVRDVLSRHLNHILILFPWIRSVYEFYARGATYEELHALNEKHGRSKWEKYIPNTSFKFFVNGYNQSIPQRRQREVVESFSYMDFLGKIDMKNPEVVMGCFEECESWYTFFTSVKV